MVCLCAWLPLSRCAEEVFTARESSGGVTCMCRSPDDVQKRAVLADGGEDAGGAARSTDIVHGALSPSAVAVALPGQCHEDWRPVLCCHPWRAHAHLAHAALCPPEVGQQAPIFVSRVQRRSTLSVPAAPAVAFYMMHPSDVWA